MENSDISGLILCNPVNSCKNSLWDCKLVNSCKNNLWDGDHATGAEPHAQSPRI